MPDAKAPASPSRNGEFTTVFRGYDPVKVDDALTQLKAELATTVQHRDEARTSVAELTKALSYSQKDLAEAKAALARMVEDPGGAAAMSERVKTMMRLAEEEIAELREKAEQEAASTREAADGYADKTREKAQAEAERLGKEAEQRRTAADKEAEQQRAAADKKAQEEIEAKRAEAERAIAERESSAKQRADAMLADAESQLTEATAKRKEALELHADVAGKLAASNTALQQALERIGATPDASADAAAD
jgi:DivIVA domain-containing protein